MNSPVVSIVLPVFNGERYLRSTIDSLLEQTLRDFELIVVDDASSDGTPAILDEYRARDERVRVVRNESNVEAAASRNRGYALSQAPLVANADADDLHDPERLRQQVAFMRAHLEVGVVGTNGRIIDEHGDHLFATELPLTHEAIRLQLNYTCPIINPSTMMRTNVLRQVGGCDPSYGTCGQDLELWSRMVQVTRVANLRAVLLSYRHHPASATHTRSESGHRVTAGVRRAFIADYLGRNATLEEAIDLHALLRRTSIHHSEDAVTNGLRVAKELYGVACRRVQYDGLRTFEEALFNALCSQAIKHGSSTPFKTRLMKEAIGISPRQLTRLSGVKKVAAMVRG